MARRDPKEARAERELAHSEMIANQIRAREIRERRERDQPIRHPTAADVEAFLRMFEALLDRKLGLERVGRDRELAVVQRCRVCRTEIVSTIGRLLHDVGPNRFPDWSARLGVELRMTYAAHDCPPVDRALTGLTVEQMDELAAQAERDLQATALRCEEIRAAFAALLAAKEVERGG